MPTPQEALLAIARRAQNYLSTLRDDAAPKPQGSGGPLEDALFDIWKLASSATEEKPRPFEVCLLTFDRISNRDWSTLARVRDQLNKNYARPEELRFIIIFSERIETAYLSYKTDSLAEADRFRTEAIHAFDAFQAEEKKRQEAPETQA